jgi:hypothetical protein
LVAVRSDNVAHGLLAVICLVENPLAGDLVDVGRKEIYAQREARLCPRKLDLSALEAVDDVVEPLL